MQSLSHVHLQHFVRAAWLSFLFLANKDEIVSPLTCIQIGKLWLLLSRLSCCHILVFQPPSINFFLSFIALSSLSNHVLKRRWGEPHLKAVARPTQASFVWDCSWWHPAPNMQKHFQFSLKMKRLYGARLWQQLSRLSIPNKKMQVQ